MFGKTKDTEHEDTTQTVQQTVYTTDTIRDMDKTEFDLIAFVLSGKVAGRISSMAMSLAGAQVRRAQHLDESDQPAIDNFNQRMAELDQIESQNEFFEHAGLEAPVDKEEQLRAWLGVRQVMIERNFVPSHLAENFKWMIDQTIKRNNPSEEDLNQLANSSGLSLEEITKIYKAKSKRAIDETMEVATHAMRLVNDYKPDDSITPVGFNQIVHDSIESSTKGAIVRGNNVEESIANSLILKAMQTG